MQRIDVRAAAVQGESHGEQILSPLRDLRPSLAARLESLQIEGLIPALAADVLIFGFLNQDGTAGNGVFQSAPPIASRTTQFCPAYSGNSGFAHEVSAQLKLLAEKELVKSSRGCYAFQNLPGLIQDREAAAILDPIIEGLLAAQSLRASTAGDQSPTAPPHSIVTTLWNSRVLDENLESLPHAGTSTPVLHEKVRLYLGQPAIALNPFMVDGADAPTREQKASRFSHEIGLHYIDELLAAGMQLFPIGAGDVLRLDPHERLESVSAVLRAGEDGRSFVLDGKLKGGQAATMGPVLIPRLAFSEDKLWTAITVHNSLDAGEHRALLEIVQSLFGATFGLANVVVHEHSTRYPRRLNVEELLLQSGSGHYCYHVLLPIEGPPAAPTISTHLERARPAPAKSDPSGSSRKPREPGHMPRDVNLGLVLLQDCCTATASLFPSKPALSGTFERLYGSLARATLALAKEGERQRDHHLAVLAEPQNHSPTEVLLAKESLAAATDRVEYFSEVHAAVHGIFSMFPDARQVDSLIPSFVKRVSRMADQTHRSIAAGAPHVLSLPHYFFSSLESACRQATAAQGWVLSPRTFAETFNMLLRSPQFEGKPLPSEGSHSSLLLSAGRYSTHPVRPDSEDSTP